MYVCIILLEGMNAIGISFVDRATCFVAFAKHNLSVFADVKFDKTSICLLLLYGSRRLLFICMFSHRLDASTYAYVGYSSMEDDAYTHT
jgi:hypothetical protein